MDIFRTTLTGALAILMSLSLSAQTYDSLTTNQINAGVHASGDLFWDLEGAPHFEVPQGQDKHAVFAAHLWLGAIDEAGGLHVTAQTYRQETDDFMPGPLADDYTGNFPTTYDRLWKVSQAEIDAHIAQWADPLYTAPSGIADWPGNGDFANGEAPYLAPFEDLNANNLYEPMLGEYPVIRGDACVFFIFNGERVGPKGQLAGEDLPVEVHGMLYGYDTPNDPIINETVFLHYRIINRRPLNLSEMYLGSWTDFDLGFFRDDAVGTDTMRNSIYAYNFDSLDVGFGGYGAMPPAMGVRMLNVPMTNSMNYLNDFSVTGNPEQTSHYYGYLMSQWKDGTPLTFGGDGYGGFVPMDHIFPGDPVTFNGWIQNVIGDQTGLMSSGPYDVPSGSDLCFDLAYVFARDSTNFASINLLRERLDAVQDFYDDQTFACRSINTGLHPNFDVNVNLYPNPVRDQLLVQWEVFRPKRMELINLQGQILQVEKLPEGMNEIRLDTHDLPAGMYMLRLADESQQVLRQFVKL